MGADSWEGKGATCRQRASPHQTAYRTCLLSQRGLFQAKPNLSIPKEINPESSLEGLKLKLKLQYFGYLMQRADSLEKTLMLGEIEGWRRRGWQRVRWLDRITHSMDMSLSKLWGIVKDRGAWHAAVQRVTKSRTWLSDWTFEAQWALVRWGSVTWQRWMCFKYYQYKLVAGLNREPRQLLTFNTPWKEFRVEIRNEVLCTLGKTGRTGLWIFRYFQEVLWIQFLHLLVSRKALKCFLVTSAACDRQRLPTKHLCFPVGSPVAQITHILASARLRGAAARSSLRCCLPGQSPRSAPSKT